MKSSDLAREAVKKKITEAFNATDDFIGIQDKKIYVQAKGEGAEVFQFAITITMPKTPLAGERAVEDSIPTPNAPQTSLSAEDAAKIQELLKRIP